MSYAVIDILFDKMVPFFMPSVLVALLLFVGLFIWPLRRKRFIARNCFIFAFLIYVVFSNSFVANGLTSLLKPKPALDIGQSYNVKGVDGIIVACDSWNRIFDLHGTKTVCSDLLACFSRAIEIADVNGGLKELFLIRRNEENLNSCFGEWYQFFLKKASSRGLAMKSLESFDLDLFFENIALGKNKRYFLVAPGIQLGRLKMMAEDKGIHIIPVACEVRQYGEKHEHIDIWPSPTNLLKSDIACYEYCAQAVLWLKRFLRSISEELSTLK